MKKFICTSIGIFSFVLLTGLVGGLECGTMTYSQFILGFTITFLVMVSSTVLGGTS